MPDADNLRPLSAPGFTVVYSPPPYGDVIPQRECKHDPAGHRMELGLRIELVGKGKRQQIVIDGQFCMKCGWCWHMDITGHGVAAEPASADWWEIYQIARAEFGDKCWQFTSRLSTLAEEVGHFSRILGLPQCRSQAIAQSALKVCRHHTLSRHGAPKKSPALKYRSPWGNYQKWPGLSRRAAQ